MVHFNKVSMETGIPSLNGTSAVNGDNKINGSIFTNGAAETPQGDDPKDYYIALNEALEGKYKESAENMGIPVASIMYRGIRDSFKTIQARYPDAQVIAQNGNSPVIRFSDNNYEYIFDGSDTIVTDKATGQKQYIAFDSRRSDSQGFWVFNYDADGNNIISGKQFDKTNNSMIRFFEYHYDENGSVENIVINNSRTGDNVINRPIAQQEGKVFRPAIDAHLGPHIDNGNGTHYIGHEAYWNVTE